MVSAPTNTSLPARFSVPHDANVVARRAETVRRGRFTLVPMSRRRLGLGANDGAASDRRSRWVRKRGGLVEMQARTPRDNKPRGPKSQHHGHPRGGRLTLTAAMSDFGADVFDQDRPKGPKHGAPKQD